MSKQRFAVFDIDGTIYRYALFQAVVDQLVEQGSLPRGFYEKEFERWQNRTHQESFSDFVQAQVSLFEGRIKKIKVADMKRAATAVLKRSSGHTYVYTRDLIKELKAKNYFLIAISGSMTEVVVPFTKTLGFDYVAPTDYQHDGEYYTGTVTLRAVDKHLHLEEIVKAHNLSRAHSIAIGDSKSDISMLEYVAHPIAFNPERKLFDHAKKQNWKIVIERKNMIYELESKDGSYILA